MPQDVGRAGLQGRLEMAGEFPRPFAVSSETWSSRLAVRMERPSRRYALPVPSAEIVEAPPEKQQSRMTTIS